MQGCAFFRGERSPEGFVGYSREGGAAGWLYPEVTVSVDEGGADCGVHMP